MKKVKSFLILPALLVSLLCMSLFSACGKNDIITTKNPKLVVSSNVKLAADGVISVLINQVYNNPVWASNPKTYTVEEAKNTFKDLNYYVEIATLDDIEDVTTLGFGELSFNKGDEFYLSVGGNNFIKGKAFTYENKKLYLAAPILAFEIANNSKIKVNGAEYNFDLSVVTNELSFSNVKWQTGSSNTAAVVENTNNKQYNLTVNNSTTYLEFYYENASQDDVVLTRRVLDGKLEGYGLTKVENTSGYPLGYYIVGWNTDLTSSDVLSKYNDKVMDYRAYIIGKGISEVGLKISIPND